MMASKKEQWTTIICPTCNHDVTTNAPAVLLKKINSALARERKEARAAAFKDAAKVVAELPVRVNRLGIKKGSDMNGWSSAINQAIGALLEAAANTEEGGGDG